MFSLLFFVAGLWILILAFVVEEDRAHLALFGLGLICFITFINRNVLLYGNPEWNFSVTESLSGVWIDGNSRITLNSDGSASFDLTSSYSQRIRLTDTLGRWETSSDFLVHILPNIPDSAYWQTTAKRVGNEIKISRGESSKLDTQPLRIIKFGNELHLIMTDYEYLLEWDGHPGFVRLK